MKVSLWVGTAPSWEALRESLEFHYNEDGDVIPSIFCQSFGIDWFDEDFLESSVSDFATIRIEQLLARHSGGAELTKILASDGMQCLPFACNAIVLIYEYAYTGQVKERTFQEISLAFFGNCDGLTFSIT